LAAKVNVLRTTMAGEKAMKVMGSAAFIGRDAVARAILSANWPKETKQQVREQFTPFVNAKTGRRDNIVALFGIRKRGRAKPYVAGYTEWGKRGPKTVGANLMTLFEKGTKWMSPRPVFKPAVDAAKGAMRQRIKDGLQRILDEAAQ
jgi:hypothetical protein